jgi:hypothetical protein
MGKFKPGESGNPVGRPKGSYGGRIMALATLDKLLARKKSQQALIRALEKELLANPVRFFRTMIMPLLPRESKLSFDHEGVIQWRSLLGASAQQGAESVEGRGLTVDVEAEDAGRDAPALPEE